MSLQIEELALNAWPSLQTIVHHGWLLRFAEGYTKRSNSIQAIYSGGNSNMEQQIDYCEKIYESAGLTTIFKMTPFGPDSLDQRLEQRGYTIAEPSNVKILDDISSIREPQMKGILIEEEWSENWLATLSTMNQLSQKKQEITRMLLRNSRLKQGFFTLMNGSGPVACGLAVMEQGYVGLYDIVTDQAYRNMGYGEQLLLHILKWAREAGAEKSYLLVVQSNASANRLYDKLNYRHLYTYWYRCKP